MAQDIASLTPSGSARPSTPISCRAGYGTKRYSRSLASTRYSRAGEELVATIAREHHGDMLCGGLPDHIGGNHRRVAEQLIEVPGQIINDAQHVGLAHELMMLGAEPIGHEPSAAT